MTFITRKQLRPSLDRLIQRRSQLLLGTRRAALASAMVNNGHLSLATAIESNIITIVAAALIAHLQLHSPDASSVPQTIIVVVECAKGFVARQFIGPTNISSVRSMRNFFLTNAVCQLLSLGS